jgi:hypothetical protein
MTVKLSKLSQNQEYWLELFNSADYYFDQVVIVITLIFDFLKFNADLIAAGEVAERSKAAVC